MANEKSKPVSRKDGGVAPIAVTGEKKKPKDKEGGSK